MHTPTFKQRFRYALDNSMSKGTIALMGWLALITFTLILIMSSIIWITGIAPDDPEAGAGDGSMGALLWAGLMRMFDAGNLNGDSGSPIFLASMLTMTIGGILIFSTLIGLLTTGIEGKLDELRKGRSLVLEDDHTLILGWSEKVFSIVSELVIANESRHKPRIVIMADVDKVEMEDEIRSRVPDTQNTRVICRTGRPMDMSDLEIVNPNGARSIILLSPEDDNPDAQVIKMILAITKHKNRRPEPFHIVAEMHDVKNAEIARMVGGDELELVISDDLISRITVQTCRQSGLSVVYTELLDYGGDEIYMAAEPTLVGKTVRESLFAYEDCAVMGVSFADGRVLLNPGMDTVLGPKDELILIAEDDSKIKRSARTSFEIDGDAIREAPGNERQPERTLILGWNRRGVFIVNELDKYVAPGSETVIVADLVDVEADLAESCAGLTNTTTRFVKGDTAERQVLEDIGVAKFDHVIILCYSEVLEPANADARTLITLLHLRHMADLSGQDYSIVGEILDARDQELAAATRADDFIVSDRLVSLMLSQISENKRLSKVFEDIFDEDGSELYIKPMNRYIAPGRAVSFYTVVESAARRGEIAIGYRVIADSQKSEMDYGVVINPDKSNRVTFAEGDQIIVVAED